MPTPESEITKMNLDKWTLELVQPCREQKIQKRIGKTDFKLRKMLAAENQNEIR